MAWVRCAVRAAAGVRLNDADAWETSYIQSHGCQWRERPTVRARANARASYRARARAGAGARGRAIARARARARARLRLTG